MGFEIAIDWMRFTLPNIDNPAEVAALFPGVFTEGPGMSGYSKSFVLAGLDGGYIRVLYAKAQAPKEVHVDISGAVVSSWSYDFIQHVSAWAIKRGAKCGRLDVAFDDFTGRTPLAKVEGAIMAGQAVRRSKRMRIIKDLDEMNQDLGETLYLGSRQSDTFLRIYDKKKQQLATRGTCNRETWVRWEIELKDERSRLFFTYIPNLPEEDFKGFAVGLLRSAVDFRDTTLNEESWTRTRAPLLAWWEELTEGLKKARLALAKSVQSINDVKAWAERSLAPILACLAASPEAGFLWLNDMIATGPKRWKQKHFDLLHAIRKTPYVLQSKYR